VPLWELHVPSVYFFERVGLLEADLTNQSLRARFLTCCGDMGFCLIDRGDRLLELLHKEVEFPKTLSPHPRFLFVVPLELELYAWESFLE
jgi:hypothetical protein